MDKNLEDEQSEQRKSSVDRTNDFINRARETKKTINTLRNLRSLGGSRHAPEGFENASKKLGTKATRSAGRAGVRAGKVAAKAGAQLARQAAIAAGEFLAATVEIWLPILLIVFIVIVVAVLIAGVSGDAPGDAGSGGFACTDLVGATCQPVGKVPQCPSGTQQDTTGATCDSATDPLTGNTINYVCCAPPQTSTDVLYWGQQINNVVTIRSGCTGTWHGYNRLQTYISSGIYTTKLWPGTCSGVGWGTYFCTFLVKDAYKLAGKWGPTDSNTCDQVHQWLNHGYPVQQNSIRGAKLGDPIWWMGDSSGRWCPPYGYSHHTNMISYISVDSGGNGTMRTIDTNNTVKVVKYNVVNWRAYYPGRLTSFVVGLAP